MNSNQRGFSLPELMVVIGIISLLAAIAVPMSIHSIAARRLGASTLEVLSFLEHSRSIAIKRGEPVYVRVDLAQRTYRATIGSASGDVVRSGKTGSGVVLQQPAADALPNAFRFIRLKTRCGKLESCRVVRGSARVFQIEMTMYWRVPMRLAA